MNFKPRVHMASKEDMLNVLMNFSLRSSIAQKKNVRILPIHITLDITVAMA